MSILYMFLEISFIDVTYKHFWLKKMKKILLVNNNGIIQTLYKNKLFYINFLFKKCHDIILIIY